MGAWLDEAAVEDEGASDVEFLLGSTPVGVPVVGRATGVTVTGAAGQSVMISWLYHTRSEQMDALFPAITGVPPAESTELMDSWARMKSEID